MLTLLSAADIVDDAPDFGDWGPWRLNASTYVLDLPERYEVDLERCLDSAQVLDWVVQVAGKTWATPEVVAGLVRALDDVLYPQSTICGSGVGKSLTAAAVRKRVVSLVERSAKTGTRSAAIRDGSRREPPRVMAHRNSHGQAVVQCPYCGREHFHGWSEGHRVAHCDHDTDGWGYVLVLEASE